jgi:hypothetical protein
MIDLENLASSHLWKSYWMRWSLLYDSKEFLASTYASIVEVKDARQKIQQQCGDGIINLSRSSKI